MLFTADLSHSSGYETDTDSPVRHNDVITSDRYRRRRLRTQFTSRDLRHLEVCFMDNPYPGIEERESLARGINVDEARIHVSSC